MSALLPTLDNEIDRRVADLVAARPDWPCRTGCDACCRSLAEPLRLTAAEWRRLEAGLEALPPEERSTVEARLADAARGSERPHICPFLDRRRGRCRVYAHRPIACRTYGFYRGRDGGRFCGLVAETIEETESEATGPSSGTQVIWGNHDAVERRLERDAGPSIPLADWWG
ncbi:MAG: YkgJ family cysteine cluster protein [Acidobacteriota bacterium]